MIRRPQLDIIALHWCILKLASIKMNGKESGLSKAELDQLNGKPCRSWVKAAWWEHC